MTTRPDRSFLVTRELVHNLGEALKNPRWRRRLGYDDERPVEQIGLLLAYQRGLIDLDLYGLERLRNIGLGAIEAHGRELLVLVASKILRRHIQDRQHFHGISIEAGCLDDLSPVGARPAEIRRILR